MKSSYKTGTNMAGAMMIGVMAFARSSLMGPTIFLVVGFALTVYLVATIGGLYGVKERALRTISQEEIDTYAIKHPQLKIPKQESRASLASITGTDSNKNGMRDHPERIMKYVYTLNQEKKSLGKINRELYNKTKKILKGAYAKSKKSVKEQEAFKEAHLKYIKFRLIPLQTKPLKFEYTNSDEYEDIADELSEKLYYNDLTETLNDFMMVMKATTPTAFTYQLHEISEDPYYRLPLKTWLHKGI